MPQLNDATHAIPRFANPQMSVAWILGAASLPGHIDPERPALRWDSTERSYGQLRSRALSLAGALRSGGLVPGDRVVGHLLNRGETFELYFACAYAGLTFVAVNWRLTPRELTMILEDCSPRALFTQQDVAEHVVAASESYDTEVVVLDDDQPGDRYEQMATGPPLEGPFELGDPQLILYTSGTTGAPKGVMLSQSNITWFALQQAAMYPAMTSEMVLLVTSPTFNTAGINELVIPTFLVGGTVTIHPSRGWSPERMAALIDRWSVTHCIVYPSMMEPLLVADRRATLPMASLRFVLSGGENCPPATMVRFQDRWRHVTLGLGYGSTESGVVTLITGDEIRGNAGSVGRTALGMAITLRGADGRQVATGETGEIWAAGGSIVPGYWKAPDLSEATLQDGWLNTGDLGRLDAQGYLYLEGRSKDLIISKGQNIYPAEVENALSEHDGLLESAVVGLPDAEWGEVVCAAVVAKPGRALGEVDIIAFVQERLASYKKPRHVIFLDDLPRNPGNKVIKSQVAELVSRVLGRDAD